MSSSQQPKSRLSNAVGQTPKMAVYGEHAYNPLDRQPSSATRSRLQLLRHQHKAPTGRWTASSYHPPASDQIADATVAPAASRHTTGNGALPAPTPQQQVLRSVDPNAAAVEYAAYVNNLREQVGVLETEVGLYRARDQQAATRGAAPVTPLPLVSGAVPRPGFASTSATKKPTQVGVPIVETHTTSLLEQLQRQNQDSAERVHQTGKKLAEKSAEEADLKQELHRLRAIAATERGAAATASRDKDEALQQKQQAESRAANTEDSLQGLQRRFDFVLEELNFVKGELDVARAQAQRTLSLPSATRDSADLAAENESLRAQLSEVKEWLQQRDVIIDQLQQAQEAAGREHATIMNNLRHEQQRYQMLAASAESMKVRLQDAESEAQYLRATNCSLQEDVKRLTRQTDELFSKIKTEMEQRQIKDAQVNNTLECTKALQSETAKVHSALVAEQGINKQLRDELDTTQRHLAEANNRNKTLKEQFEALQQSLAAVQDRYNARTAELEDHMGRWKQIQARQLSAERQQIELASHLILEMKSDAETIQKRAEAVASKLPTSPPATAAAPTPTPPTPPPPHPAIDVLDRVRSPEVAKIEDEVRQAMQREKESRVAADEVRQLALKALRAVAQDIPPPPPLPPH